MDRREATFPPRSWASPTAVEARILGLLDARDRRAGRASTSCSSNRSTSCGLSSSPAASGCGPRSVICAFVGSGGDPTATRSSIDAAAALELVHTFALVHDDVMDGSDTRRNRDAVHRHFTRRHDDARWRGEARRFGEGMAILVGDFAFVYADMLVRGAPARCVDVSTTSCASSCASGSRSIW